MVDTKIYYNVVKKRIETTDGQRDPSNALLFFTSRPLWNVQLISGWTGPDNPIKYPVQPKSGGVLSIVVATDNDYDEDTPPLTLTQADATNLPNTWTDDDGNERDPILDQGEITFAVDCTTEKMEEALGNSSQLPGGSRQPSLQIYVLEGQILNEVYDIEVTVRNIRYRDGTIVPIITPEYGIMAVDDEGNLTVSINDQEGVSHDYQLVDANRPYDRTIEDLNNEWTSQEVFPDQVDGETLKLKWSDIMRGRRYGNTVPRTEYEGYISIPTIATDFACSIPLPNAFENPTGDGYSMWINDVQVSGAGVTASPMKFSAPIGTGELTVDVYEDASAMYIATLTVSQVGTTTTYNIETITFNQRASDGTFSIPIGNSKIRVDGTERTDNITEWAGSSTSLVEVADSLVMRRVSEPNPFGVSIFINPQLESRLTGAEAADIKIKIIGSNDTGSPLLEGVVWVDTANEASVDTDNEVWVEST